MAQNSNNGFGYFSPVRDHCAGVGNGLHSQSGFSATELVVVVTIMLIAANLGFPAIIGTYGQMSSSRDARILQSKLSYYRAEAMRLRVPVRVSFTQSTSSTAGTFSVDFGDDSSTEETVELTGSSIWQVSGSPATPADIVFNGLGLMQSGTALELSIYNHDSVSPVSILGTGMVKHGTL